MRPQRKTPYVARCAVCEDGLLRLFVCCECGAVVAICDECELIWQDLAAVSRDPASPSDSAFPACPACDAPKAHWQKLTTEDIQREHLHVYLAEPNPKGDDR